MRKPDESLKIDNETIEFTFWNPNIGYSKKILKVKKIGTRIEAIEMCNNLTKIELKKDNAINNLRKFRSDFSKHRNYEIENYIAELTGDFTYKIVEVCPFNKFSWFTL